MKASFVRGGSTRYLVEMLQEGLTGYILDGQTFDLDARSFASPPIRVMSRLRPSRPTTTTAKGTSRP